MRFLNAKDMRNIHFCLSVFFIPFILMYIGTGVMYIFGFNQNAGARVTSLEIDKVLTLKNIPEIKEIAREKGFFIKNERIAKARGSNVNFSLNSPKIEISIAPKEDKTTIKFIERKFWGAMLLMHTSKAGIFMNTFAVITAFSILIVYLSGFIMTSFSKYHRKYTLLSFCVGVFFFSLIYIFI